MQKKPNIFLDLDETLVHTLIASTEKRADELLLEHGEHYAGMKFKMRGDSCWYVPFKRKISDDLIKFCKDLVGEKNVYILSHGSLDYVLWVNVHHQLGLDPNTQIYGREDISRINGVNPKFKGQFNILVDNESYDWHESIGISKLSFLDEIPRSQFVHIQPFDVFDKIENAEETLADTKKKLEQIVKNGQLTKTV